MSVVVDTSIWVEYLRGNGYLELEALLEEGGVVLAPVVAAELMSPPLARHERTDLRALLDSLPMHPAPLAHWCAVGELRQRLGRRGLTVSTPDAHVAQCALETNGSLWSRDVIFRKVAAETKLRLFSP